MFYSWLVAFKALGKLILDVGLMLAYHCDLYGKSSMYELLIPLPHCDK